MKIKTKIIDDVAVIIPHGKMMGPPDTDDLHNEIKSVLGQNIKKIVVDLAHVKWMNSLGVGALMSSFASVKNAGGVMKLSSMTEKVRSVMLIMQLVKVFETYESYKDAVESFNK